MKPSNTLTMQNKVDQRQRLIDEYRQSLASAPTVDNDENRVIHRSLKAALDSAISDLNR